MDEPRRLWCAWGILALGAIACAAGLAQALGDPPIRAHAFFETAAVYAAMLNVVLVFMLATLVQGRMSTRLVAIAALFAAAVFAAQSRGAAVSLGFGCAAIAVLSLRAQTLNKRLALAVAVALTLSWIASDNLRTTHVDAAIDASEMNRPATDAARKESTLGRLELYALAWNAWRASPLTGNGYLTFQYQLEQHHERTPAYGQTNETWFVHNDYLQSLQELGPLGLAGILGISLLPLWLGYRRLVDIAPDERRFVVASTAAAASMACHALVDFPFHVPACLVLYGGLLGALDARLASGNARPSVPAGHVPGWRRLRRIAVVLAMIVLARPLVAEAVAAWGMHRYSRGASQDAALWLAIAARVEPADWRYHWYAGQFWDNQARSSRKPAAARLAVQAFESGFEANPYEVTILLGLISVERRHRKLLGSTTSPDDFHRWVERAVQLAPLDPAVVQERQRVEAFLAQGMQGAGG
ncbi:MAG: O-antigen ligase family protein [Burkholderiales bacterium]